MQTTSLLKAWPVLPTRGVPGQTRLPHNQRPLYNPTAPKVSVWPRVQAQSAAPQSLEPLLQGSGVARGGGGATRQIARLFELCGAYNSANARQACEGIGVTVA